MKRISALLLSALMVFGLAGCSRDNSATADPPEYTSTEKFEVGMWVGVSDKLVTYDEDGQKVSERMLTDAEFLEKYQEIADAGFTIAFPGYDVMINGGDYNLKALEAASEVGIKQIISDSALSNLMMQAETLVESGVYPRDEIVEQTRDILSPYLESEYADALYGFMIDDEPGAALFSALEYGRSIFEEAAPDLMFYVNLFPIIAGGAQLSGTTQAITYDDYLSNYFGTVKTDYISYDHYPLYGSGDGSTSIEPTFLYNMDLIRTKIDEEGADREFWTFLQSIQYGGRNRALTSKADATFQAYSFMAFGGDCIQWFCYACPPANDGATAFGNNALIDRNYEKTATYDYVSGANKDVQSFMPYYKNFNWQGIALSEVYDDTDNFEYLSISENLVTGGALTSFTSTEDAFAGVFEDKDGNPGYFAVNFTDPALNKSNEITMTFGEGYENVLIVKPEGNTALRLDGGSVTFTLGVGEAAFVIPY